MTARNYCPAGDVCDHLTRKAKREAHGTPQEFETAVLDNVTARYMTIEEAALTIQRYRAEYEAAKEN
jgi:hypothetical protein